MGFDLRFASLPIENIMELHMNPVHSEQNLQAFRRRIPLAIAILRPLVPIFIFLFTVGAPVIMAEKKNQSLVDCDIHKGGCTKYLAGRKVSLDINPKPVAAMKDLTFIVRLSGKQPAAAPYIDLGMPGMNMGPNRLSLKALGEGTYEGNGIIVRCPSGHSTWKATVTVPDLGSVEFIFDVAY
jgi:hypothetical protein